MISRVLNEHLIKKEDKDQKQEVKEANVVEINLISINFFLI